MYQTKQKVPTYFNKNANLVLPSSQEMDLEGMPERLRA